MSKISPNMIRNICSVKSVTDMFLDFEKNKYYFDEGTLEDYLQEIRNFVSISLNKHNNESSFIMEKDMISSLFPHGYTKYRQKWHIPYWIGLARERK